LSVNASSGAPGANARVGQKLRHLLEPGGLRSALQARLSTHNFFVEMNHASDRALYVAGSRRGGTTWLSEVLAEAYRCRLIQEPLRSDHAVRGARWFSFGRYLDPDDPAPDVEAFVRRVLEGRVRAVWSDRENTVRFVRRRLVKDVWQNPLVPWIARHFPDVPIIYILRHPVPSAWSLVKLGWEVYLEPMLAQPTLVDGPLANLAAVVSSHRHDEDPLVPHVLRWCIENYVLTKMLERDRVHVLYFEDLVEHPDVELARVDAYLHRFATGAWKLRRETPQALTRPSFTDYRGSATAMDTDARARLLDGWTLSVPPDTVDRALELVKAFGLDLYYGRDVRPLVDATSVLDASVRSTPSS